MEDLKVLICRWLHLTYLETHALSVLRLPFKDHDMSSQTMLNRITSNYANLYYLELRCPCR